MNSILKKPIFMIPLAILITNIGNGMYTLAVGVLMYQKTGSTSAFAFVLVLESLINFLIQATASVAVDKGTAKKCAVISDIVRGVFVIIAGLFVSQGYIGAIYIGVFAINLMKPFFKTSMFAIGPLMYEDDKLAQFMSRISISQQTGQLIGAGIASTIIALIGGVGCIIVNGISFFLSAACFLLIEIPEIKSDEKLKLIHLISPKLIFEEWKNALKKISQSRVVMLMFSICFIDFLVVNFINMIYAPVIAGIKTSLLWISAWDALFAVGAIIGASIFSKIRYVRDRYKVVPVCLLFEGISLLIFKISSPLIITIGMIFIGMINSISVSNISYKLQTGIGKTYNGRIAGVRQFLISGTSIIFIPLISKQLNISVLRASNLMCGICVIGALIAVVCLYYFESEKKIVKNVNE